MNKQRLLMFADAAYKQANHFFVLLAAVTFFAAIFSSSIYILEDLRNKNSELIVYFVLTSKTVLAITMLAIIVHVVSWSITITAMIIPKDAYGKQNRILFCVCSIFLIILVLAFAFYLAVLLATLGVIDLSLMN